MNRLINTVVVLFLILSVNGSCRREITKDLSLTAEEYQKLGMPDHNKIWTNNDYSDANITLSSLRIDYPYSLPRKGSKKSGTLFSRFVNEENLLFANDTTLPLHLRAYQIQHFERLQSTMGKAYTVERNEEKYYKKEMIDLEIFGLSVREKMMELAWAIMDSDDEYDISLQTGMQAVKNNYLRFIAGLLDEQAKPEEYPAKDLGRLSERVSVSVIKNNEWFLPADRESIIARLETAIDKSPSGIIKNNYLKALNALDIANSRR